jgi:hypothetical protein
MSSDPDRLRVACINCGTTFLSDAFGAGARIEGNIQNCRFCGHFNVLPTGVVADLKKSEPPESGARDLKFTSALPYGNLPSVAVQTAGLRMPIASFVTNAIRIRSMLVLPVHLASLTGLYQKFSDEAILAIKGSINADLSDESARMQIRARGSELWAAWLAREDSQRITTDYGIDILTNRVKADSNPFLWLGHESILIAQVTGMWTAFEVLSGDLWEASLNSHPHTLAELKGRKFKKQGQAYGNKVPKDDENQIRLGIVQRHGWNISEKMGTILKEKFRFSELAQIRDAYWKAFGSKEIGEIIERDCISTLAALRHIFVHRAGFVDRQFKRDTSACALVATIEEDQRVPIDGPFVRALISPVLAAVGDLIAAVDKWMIDHPQAR